MYHFISYLPCNGKLWELDGLKGGPVCLGECSEENWLDVVRPMIMQRIEQYSSREIRFNLMGVIADRRLALQEQQASIEKERSAGRKAAARCEELESDVAVLKAELDAVSSPAARAAAMKSAGKGSPRGGDAKGGDDEAKA